MHRRARLPHRRQHGRSRRRRAAHLPELFRPARGRPRLFRFRQRRGRQRISPSRRAASRSASTASSTAAATACRSREGLPAADGETLPKSADLDIFVRDRAPSVRFLGTAYVLPAGGEPTIPDRHRQHQPRQRQALPHRRPPARRRHRRRHVPDPARLLGDRRHRGEVGREGLGRHGRRRERDQPRDHHRDSGRRAGAEAQARRLHPDRRRAVNSTGEDWAPKATQWFIVTDLGLTTLSGNDGLHVMVRSLGNAGPVGDVHAPPGRGQQRDSRRSDDRRRRLRALRARPDARHRRHGAGPARRRHGGGDYSFLDLSKAAMDLTDRGVEGREPPKPLDVFLTTERGIYRVGETVYATALVRDATADRGRGRAADRHRHPPGRQGAQPHRARRPGRSAAPSRRSTLPANAMRGTWRDRRLRRREGLGARRDDLPGRGFRARASRLRHRRPTATAHRPAPRRPSSASTRASSTARRPPNLNVEGETVLKPRRDLAAYPGLRLRPRRRDLRRRRPSRSPASRPTKPATRRFRSRCRTPRRRACRSTATINVRVLDTSGRPVERNHRRCRCSAATAASASSRSSTAPPARTVPVAFEVIAVDRDGARIAAQALDWSLYEIRTDFQWYRADGRWNYETIETKTRVANGTVDIAADRPARIEAHGRVGQLSARGREPDRRRASGELRFRGRLVRRGEGARHAGGAEGLARQGALRGRRDGARPSRDALQRRRAGHGGRRPADRDEVGRGHRQRRPTSTSR